MFGTVVDWRASVIREVQASAPGVDAAAFADQWRREGYRDAIASIRRGEQPWADADTLHRRKLDELLVQHGVTGMSEPAVAELSRAWHRLDPWPDSVPGLTRLKTKYLVSPLSNGNLGLLANMAKRAGLPWDFILSADMFGLYKPDPGTYLGAAKLLGLEPGRVMMVAAHTADLRAAAALGLRTAFVARPDEHGPGVPNEPAPEGVDVATTSFVELADRLGC